MDQIIMSSTKGIGITGYLCGVKQILAHSSHHLQGVFEIDHRQNYKGQNDQTSRIKYRRQSM